ILSDGTQRWIDYKEAKGEQEFQLIVDFELRCMRVFELLGNGYQILLNETYMILEQVKQYQKTLKRRKIDDCFKTTTTTTTRTSTTTDVSVSSLSPPSSSPSFTDCVTIGKASSGVSAMSVYLDSSISESKRRNIYKLKYNREKEKEE